MGLLARLFGHKDKEIAPPKAPECDHIYKEGVRVINFKGRLIIQHYGNNIKYIRGWVDTIKVPFRQCIFCNEINYDGIGYWEFYYNSKLYDINTLERVSLFDVDWKEVDTDKLVGVDN